MDIKGKKAIVTGAAKGIGKGISLKLAEYGADLSLVDIDQPVLAETEALIKDKYGVDTLCLNVDVASIDQTKSMVEETLARFGTIDILVNNVGWDVAQPFWETTEEFRRKIIDVNYRGPVNCCYWTVPHMIEKRSGKIVNISSDAGRVGSLGETVYAGCKGGVIAFTKSLAREVARYKINVNSVSPGPTMTPGHIEGTTEKLREALKRAIPMGRQATPEELANAVLFFASPLSDFVTGQVLSVSGGLTMVD
ncbi:MAG: SDR family oxidoreductase [Deltaproteobacteria bacterium]|nr:SDR family oxidoreductase [Deltaproteobacteria bacterium]MBW1921891.1 SDR family oxidoreductase [Deltaproteobacteria bacterium]MBW1948054.1 SDR family oxidoreductase [Deltaproteobacteria bacterium]MBW2006911.1 SDR family oxidoreductase [Deltaproteobacteria bacterium]MBW2348633.1 SDR family oxidoreductase [Deltaproteobacteria bacterium]